MKTITDDDYRVVRQPILDIRLRFEIYDRNDMYIDTINTSVINGSGNIDAESDIRRSFSVTVIPDAKSKIIIKEQGYIWIDKFIHVYIGIVDMRTNEVREWKFGEFIFTNTNTTYDPVTDQMNINCSDMMSFLDGSKNGELGQLTISYPAYEEDENGVPIHYNTIRNAVIDTISQLGRINDFEIDDIGEYNAMPLYNEDYEQYRIQTTVELPDGTLQQLWNTIPFDQTFSSGTTVLNILTTFRDLYPNYEIYFNEDGVFCMNMIPSGDEDPIIIDDPFFQSVYISENTNIDLTTVRNVSHVWGQVLETDYYSEDVEFGDGVYKVTDLEGYEENYKNGDRFALKIPVECGGRAYLYTEEDYDFEIEEAASKNIVLEKNIDAKTGIVNPEKPLFYRCNKITEGENIAEQLGLTFVSFDYVDKAYININNFGKIPIYDENTEDYLDTNNLKLNTVYVFKIKSKYINSKNEFRAYWLGAWQVQGIVALVDNNEGEDGLYVPTTLRNTDDLTIGFFNVEDGEFYRDRTIDEVTGKYVYSTKYMKAYNTAYYQEDIDVYYRVVNRYSKEYFQEVYACPSVRLRIIPQSPYTCQKIGEYMDVMTDDKNITSDSLAVSRADWEIYKQARITDSISITTLLCPFADVNIKVAYKRHDLKRKNPYIVKNISHDFSGGTTTWQLMRFYPLYERINYTHDEIYDDELSHNDLSAFTHERI